ncbi:hypothetical protein SORDD16_00448 [Streptococcus oralis]|uniref:Uncharacterized protein n=1 Tax=Streptococcus oralis TaxID=1303 RepID=A0A139PF52_STROR|nr:hypothetical protein SORDD16_00448 [Streptococcus oralis]
MDTVIFGNPKALELAVDFFGLDHVPFGLAPTGAWEVISQAIESLPLSQAEKEQIFSQNIIGLVGDKA